MENINSSNPFMLNILKVKKSYSNFTLDISELVFNDRGITALVGNNGAGKSTFFSILLDLVKPDELEVDYNSSSIKNLKAIITDVGVFLNNSFLIDYLYPDEYLSFVLNLKKGKNNNVEKCNNIIEYYTKLFNIDSSIIIDNLSTGNKQKIGLISAIISNPKIIILDEPFSNLDPTTRQLFAKILKKLSENNLIIISSHDIDFVENFVERIILLDDGNVKYDMLNNTNNIKLIYDFFKSKADDFNPKLY